MLRPHTSDILDSRMRDLSRSRFRWPIAAKFIFSKSNSSCVLSRVLLSIQTLTLTMGSFGALLDAVQGEQKVEALKRYDGLKLVKTLVDVGGNKGRALATIVAAHPYIRGINFDLPHVVAEAPDIPGRSRTFLSYQFMTSQSSSSSCRISCRIADESGTCDLG